MNIKRVFLVYKSSAYKNYFLNKDKFLHSVDAQFVRQVKKRFKMAHDQHYETLDRVMAILSDLRIDVKKRYRGNAFKASNDDLIITIGGDGTFLEAARQIKNQFILGVNSAPEFSVGRFCIATAQNLKNVLIRILKGTIKTTQLQRIRLTVGPRKKEIDALNDALICHRNPAALCRYHLKIGTITEEQRSSGIWVCTPAGSSGAMMSAGGTLMKADEKRLQYMPRELYHGKKAKYHLKGGVVGSKGKIIITSMMKEGMIYFDGANDQCAFPYGAKAKIVISPHPINTFLIK